MKELKNFPGYFITEDGRVYCNRITERFSKGQLRELKKIQTTNGYLKVNLYHNGKMSTKTIHRLVAENYIPNPNNLPQVNHIDEDKTNNNVGNLEWCSNHYNAIHSHCRWKWKIKNIITGELYETTNISEFCRCYKIDQRHLCRTFTGKYNQHKNYKIISKEQFK